MGVMFVQFLQDYACRASVDSLLNPMDTILSLRSKGVILHSAATAQSTMDYSTMAVDEGVVDSPISRVSIPNCVISPSPMWPRSVPDSPCMNKDNCTLVKRILYGDSRESFAKDLLKVQFYAQFCNGLFIHSLPATVVLDLRCIELVQCISIPPVVHLAISLIF